MRRELVVNGFPVVAEFADKDVEEALVPLLRSIAHADEKRKAHAGCEQCVNGAIDAVAPAVARTIVLLAAPPGSGKSTLAALLQELSREFDGCVPIEAVGMDGFHFPNVYLDTHHLGDAPTAPTLRSVKGAPETFDVSALASKLEETRRLTGAVLWPAYSRTTHDVVADALAVTGEIVLVEGNYLLLDEPAWRDLRAWADLAVFLGADEELLHRRLVERKVTGGMLRADAEAFYAASDGPNVKRVLAGSLPADITLHLDARGHLTVV